MNPKSVTQPALRRYQPAWQAAIIPAFYVVVATLYIICSTHMAQLFARDEQHLQQIETIKGIAFVVVTGLSLFLFCLFWEKRKQRQNELLVQTECRALVGLCSASIAHDLNNLLMMLSGLTFMFSKQKQEDEKLSNMFDQINLSVEKLTKLSRNLSETARSSNPEEKEIIELSAQIPIIVALLHKHPDVYKSKLTAKNIPAVSLPLNRVLFEQSLINLIVNAAQASGEHAIIEVAVQKEDDGVVLEVHDNGPGIPKESVKSIFEPGYTTKKNGSGLGMLSVSAFAKSCDGKISITKSHLDGALIQIRIPFRKN